jgi:hypothetical protein
MKTIKKIFRLFVMIFFIALASTGIGIGGAIFPNHREKYMNKRNRIEMLDKKNVDNDGELKAIE